MAEQTGEQFPTFEYLKSLVGEVKLKEQNRILNRDPKDPAYGEAVARHERMLMSLGITLMSALAYESAERGAMDVIRNKGRKYMEQYIKEEE